MSDYMDILSDALEFLGGKPVVDDNEIKYGPLVLSVAPKGMDTNLHHVKATSLLADHLFSPSIFLAERIERGLLGCEGKTALELGAGAALPSLLLSTLPNPPKLLVVTDHPDEAIYGNLRKVVSRNQATAHPTCKVIAQGYAWGDDPSSLLALLPFDNNTGFEVMILSDLLHFDSCHDLLVSSVTTLLKKAPESVAHVSAGVYTKPDVCNSFIKKIETAGLHIEEVISDPQEPWMGTLHVSGLDANDLALRKANCRYWVARWAA
ncbi:hypothetical protein D9611_011921 [Ephemerocybe angulata]|uniref:Uncharacterized protein n=1 Tax=Ephemerocybe angulata TaxID=980116 RepID=A0A8H5C3P8_9AGAR|nr:hypothetical protein D9611_011921 [Tulosesus angulatus]